MTRFYIFDKLYGTSLSVYTSSSLPGYPIWLVPMILLFLGLATILLSILGCWGMAIKNKYTAIPYFSAIILLIAGELAVGGYWIAKGPTYEQYLTLRESFLNYDYDVSMEWSQMQIKLQCCGVNDAFDYSAYNRTVPTECCLGVSNVKSYVILKRFRHLNCEAEHVNKPGCKQVFLELFQTAGYFIIVCSMGGAIIKILFLLSSFVIRFEEVVEDVRWSPVGSILSTNT